MSIVVTAATAPRTVRDTVGTRRMAAVATAVAGGVTALALGLLGPSAVLPLPPTVVNRRR
jgi:hypothetical protein